MSFILPLLYFLLFEIYSCTPGSASSTPAPPPKTPFSIFNWTWKAHRKRVQRDRRLAEFFQACTRGSQEMVSTMIFSAWEDSIDINTVNPRFEGRTCLMNAALAQQTDLVSYLLFRGASLTQLDVVGRNVLQLVIGDEKSAASAPIVEMLLNHAGRILRHSELYPFVNIQAGDRGPYDVLHSSSSFPPIILAIIKKREDLVQLLLSDKLPTDLQVSASQFANESPLMAAIEHGTVGIMKLLLKKGSSDLNHQDLWRGTPLWSACSQSHTSSEKLQMLLNHENGIINPNTLDLRGYTPLLTCALKSFRATELLLSHFKTRLDISQPSLKGFSILHHAVDSHHASNSIEFVRLFLNAARESGQLFRILERKNPSSGMNPLHLVSHFSGVTTATENRDIAALLVESAMSLNNSSLIINSADDYGNTPLMRALSFSNPTANNVAVISILLEKGFANVNLRNHIGETAADIAFGNGRSDKGYLLECKMIIKPLTEEEKECCVCFEKFRCENPQVKPYLCDHSVDKDCFKRMEAAAASTNRNTGSNCPQCRARKRRVVLAIDGDNS